jgi:hypothetical protein
VLDRTTDSKGTVFFFRWWHRPDGPATRLVLSFGPLSMPGTIRQRDWYGKDGMEHVRTVKEPKQAIPTFMQTVELLRRVRVRPS